MYLRKKRNKSGSISVVVVDKSSGKYKEVKTIGIAKNASDVTSLIERGRRWISDYDEHLHPRLDFDGGVVSSRERERQEMERAISSIENVLLNGCELILDSVQTTGEWENHQEDNAHETTSANRKTIH